jgi:replication factor A1
LLKELKTFDSDMVASPTNRIQDSSTVALPWDGPEPVLSTIKSISPYSNKWTIKVRIIQKNPIKDYDNARSKGTMFNVTFGDDSGKIRATGFNNLCDLFYPMLALGKVYYVSGCQVGVSNRQFSNVDSNYELIFKSTTDIWLCTSESESSFSEMLFEGGIAKIGEVDENTKCNLIGVLHACGDLSEIIMRRNGRPLKKRELTLVDKSGYSIQTVLWGNDAEQFTIDDTDPHPIIVFHGVRVSDFGGRSLSLPPSGVMIVDPDITEAHRLRRWYDNEGSSSVFSTFNRSDFNRTSSPPEQSHNSIMRIEDVINSSLGTFDKPDYFNVLVDIAYIKPERLYYPSCKSESCNRKVIQDNNAWICEICQRVYDSPDWRYILILNICDESGNLWIHTFGETGLVIFGVPANILHSLKEKDEDSYNELLKKPLFNKYKICCRANKHTFDGVTKPRYTVQSIALISI